MPALPAHRLSRSAAQPPAPPHHSVRLLAASVAIVIGLNGWAAAQQNPPSSADSTPVPGASAAGTYRPEVVAKAEAILEKAQLRRSGQQWQSLAAVELARSLSSLSRQRRELRLLQNERDQVSRAIEAINQQMSRLQTRDGELNLQLARIAAGDVTTNNKLVAMINATRTQLSQHSQRRTAANEVLRAKRAAVNTAEADYAEQVFQTRAQFDAVADQLRTELKDSQVQIAIRVLHTNFGLPANPSADEILRGIEKRLLDVEQEVFRESMPLDLHRNGSMYINVSVNGQTVPMVVDSGASVIVLSSATAAKLDVPIPEDAPRRRVMLANGQPIESRGVTLQRVRVGEFTAAEVEAIVLGPEASNAEPLLGMSFLGRFKFEIDPAEKSLRLLRVGDADEDD